MEDIYAQIFVLKCWRESEKVRDWKHGLKPSNIAADKNILDILKGITCIFYQYTTGTLKWASCVKVCVMCVCVCILSFNALTFNLGCILMS